MRLFLLHVLVPVVVSLSLVACVEMSGPTEAESPLETNAHQASVESKIGMTPLPAYALPHEMLPGGKGDAASDGTDVGIGP